ncbi:MAG: hypothetical protein J6X31_04690 [Bacteroidales bacterium]|nr:hypothetical protein [Bacteroidales bacterium]
MKHALFLTLAAGLALFSSCSNGDSSCERVTWDESIFAEAEELAVDTVPLSRCFPYARHHYFYNDSIVIVMNHQKENLHYVEMYNTKTDSVVCRLLRNGRGPGEAISLFPIPTVNEQYFYDGDHGKKELIIFNIDSLLENPDAPLRRYGKTEWGYASKTMLYRDTLIGENTNVFTNKALGIHQEGPRFVVYDAAFEKVINDKEYEYFTFNANNTAMVNINTEKGMICFANSAEPYVEFHRGINHPVKIYEGPHRLDIEYALVGKEVMFKEKCPYSYLSSCHNRDFVYLYYVGHYDEELTYTKGQYDYYILKFDWNGNLVKTYKTDYYIDVLSCDHNGNAGKDVLYASIETEEEPLLLRLSEK